MFGSSMKSGATHVRSSGHFRNVVITWESDSNSVLIRWSIVSIPKVHSGGVGGLLGSILPLDNEMTMEQRWRCKIRKGM
jgi:hypothetical protein